MRRIPVLSVTLGILLATFTIAAAGGSQFRLPRLPRNIPTEVPRVDRLPSLDDLLGREPLTSSLDDAVTEVPFLDRFEPVASPLLELPFGLGDGVTLVPGAWSSLLQSYCLKAGTYGPTRGDGYLWAPLKGPKADSIKAVLNRAAAHPDLPQQDIQVLLWGIIAKSRVSTLDAGPRRAAELLLSESQIASIDGSALDVIPDEWLNRLAAPVAGPIRRVLEAENRLRQLLANPAGVAYDVLERVAVLHGVPPLDERGREVPAGRWSWNPDGFFVRFLPNSYTNMTLQIYSPERFDAVRGPDGELRELRDVAGATLRVEYQGEAASRATFAPAGGEARAIELAADPAAAAAAGREAAGSAARLAGAAASGAPRAKDVQDVAALATLVRDEEASLFLHRALASAAGDWARAGAAGAALAEARHLSASRAGFFARPAAWPMAYQRRGGGGWGGGGGGAGGGGGGGGMGGGGRQRLGPSLRKFGDDNSIDRARNAVNKFGAANNVLSAATDPAGLFGMSIPGELFGRILDFNFDKWEKASGALAGDPPRPDFREFTKPIVGDIPRVEPSGELTPEAAERLNAIARNLVTANAYLEAAIVALDRHGGAVEEGDRAWATRQAHALTYLKREAGLLTLEVVARMEAFDRGVPANGDRTALIDGMRELGAHFASLPAIGPPW